MRFTVVGPNGTPGGAMFDLHKAGCRDLARLRADKTDIEADDAAAAVAQWIDPEMVGMGYTAKDVRVLPCCK